MHIGSGGGFKSDINVTPLVDVVLVLLIIFMVVTPLMQRGHPVELPEADNVEVSEVDHEQMVVVVDAAGEVFVGEVHLELDAVQQEITTRLEYNPHLELLVKGDKGLEFGEVRRVMRACRRAGATRVVLVTRERKSRKRAGEGEG